MKKILYAAAFAALALAGPAAAQDFPTRPITMVIPFAAGGPQDTIGRIIAQRMSELLGQQVVVENVGGAGGMTGSKRVADAKPDGYTMVLGSVGTHAQNQTLYKRPLYNVVNDFTPVAYLAIAPIALITRPDLPRPYRAWGYPVTPLVFLSVTAFMMYYLVSERPVQSLIGVLMMASGLALYYLSRTRVVPGLATPT